MKPIKLVMLTLVAMLVAGSIASAQTISHEELNRHALERRAFEAAIWPPAGKEANWIQTAPGRVWFPYFRLYGPEKPLFQKTWKLPDIEIVK